MNGDSMGAIQNFEKALEYNSNSYEAWHYRGVIFDDCEGDIFDLDSDRENAIKSYEKALTLNSTHEDSWLKLMKLLYRLNRFENLADCLTSADNKSNDMHSIYSELASYCHLHLEDFHGSLTLYDMAEMMTSVSVSLHNQF